MSKKTKTFLAIGSIVGVVGLIGITIITAITITILSVTKDTEPPVAEVGSDLIPITDDSSETSDEDGNMIMVTDDVTGETYLVDKEQDITLYDDTIGVSEADGRTEIEEGCGVIVYMYGNDILANWDRVNDHAIFTLPGEISAYINYYAPADVAYDGVIDERYLSENSSRFEFFVDIYPEDAERIRENRVYRIRCTYNNSEGFYRFYNKELCPEDYVGT